MLFRSDEIDEIEINNILTKKTIKLQVNHEIVDSIQDLDENSYYFLELTETPHFVQQRSEIGIDNLRDIDYY